MLKTDTRNLPSAGEVVIGDWIAKTKRSRDANQVRGQNNLLVSQPLL